MRHSKLIALMLLIMPCTMANAECMKTSAEFDRKVELVLKQVNARCYDVNRDGRVNCIDHAVLFKVYWDKQFDKEDCQIVRNFNRDTGMSHLFVQVWDHGWCRMVEVETWIEGGDYSHKYRCLECVWGSKYSHWNNRYYETEYWLRIGRFRR